MAESLTTRFLNVFGLQKKGVDVPAFGGSYRDPYSQFRFMGWGWNKSRGRTDYRSEVGDLDGNSLAMAVVNYTATRIPEAKPCVVTKNKEGDETKDHLHD